MEKTKPIPSITLLFLFAMCVSAQTDMPMPSPPPCPPNSHPAFCGCEGTCKQPHLICPMMMCIKPQPGQVPRCLCNAPFVRCPVSGQCIPVGECNNNSSASSSSSSSSSEE